MKRQRLVAAILSSLVCTGIAADDGIFDAIPLPPGADSELVALGLVQNGYRVSIATLEPAATIEDTLTFYRERWSEPVVERSGSEIPGHLESAAGDWSIISRIEDEYNLVVQLRQADDGIEGLLSVLELDLLEPAVAAPPLPPGSEIISTTSADDAGLASTTTLISSRARPGIVAAFYREQLARDGWQLVSDSDDNGPTVLLLERSGARMELVSTDAQQGSLTVVNEVHTND